MKRLLVGASRAVAVFLLVLLAFLVTSALVGGPALTPAEERDAGLALMGVAAAQAALLTALIRGAVHRGAPLVAAIFAVVAGVETVLTQIETLWFNEAVQFPLPDLAGIVAVGLLRAALIVPLAVWLLGRVRQEAARPATAWRPPRDAVRRLGLLAGLYLGLYFVFGYYVAFRFEAVRLYYTGTAEVSAFLPHMVATLRADPGLAPFQLLRGSLWAALAAIIVWLVGARRRALPLAAASFGGWVALPLLFPNPYMPEAVRWGHFVELTTSMAVFGLIAAWAWRRAPAEACADPVQAPG